MEEYATTPAGDATATSPGKGAAGEARAILPPGQFGAIRLIRRIGSGGMGEVWLATHEILGRDVAVKMLSTAVGGRADPAVAGFIQGAKVAASRRHPGLNTVYHADVAEGTPYLVLEYLDGPNLQELVARSGRLEPPAARAVIEAVGEAVAELHRQDLVHRDLKPSNIVLTRDGRVVVTDFGLACAGPALALRANSGVVAGTPAYMAPEMFEGVVSARTDVYAIGMTAYQLLCGRPAFAGSFEALMRQHQTGVIDIEPLRAAGVPGGVIDVVVRATSREVLFRPKTARHVLDAFRAAFDAAGIEPATPASLARIVQDRAPSSSDAAQQPDAVTGAAAGMAETIAQFAARKRGLRERETVHDRVASRPVPQADPVHATRRRAERRRAWIAGLIATAAGGCAGIAAVWLVMRSWRWWEHWLAVDLAHMVGVRNAAPRLSSSGALPQWAQLLAIGVAIGAFVVIPVCVSTLLYRLLRGRPLPPETENTVCGWCQHDLRGISSPVCAECGHRIGDTGPDEHGILPLSRRWPRRLATLTLLPLVFWITTFAAAFVASLLWRFVTGKPGIVGIGGAAGPFNVMPIAVFPGVAVTLAFYEEFLQFDLRHSGRAWCRTCKGELRDLAEPVCPRCGTGI